MALHALVWTYVFLFLGTGVITLLSLVGLINIDHDYMKKLFTVLILEVVLGSTGVVAIFFRRQVEPADCMAQVIRISGKSGTLVLFEEGEIVPIEKDKVMPDVTPPNHTVNADGSFYVDIIVRTEDRDDAALTLSYVDPVLTYESRVITLRGRQVSDAPINAAYQGRVNVDDRIEFTRVDQKYRPYGSGSDAN